MYRIRSDTLIGEILYQVGKALWRPPASLFEMLIPLKDKGYSKHNYCLSDFVQLEKSVENSIDREGTQKQQYLKIALNINKVRFGPPLKLKGYFKYSSNMPISTAKCKKTGFAFTLAKNQHSTETASVRFSKYEIQNIASNISFYNEEQIYHFCKIFLICFLRNVIEFVFTSRNFTCTSDSLLSNLDDERKESLNSKVFGCDIQIGQKGFKQTNNLKTYFASGCDLSPKHFTIWNSWSISESPRK